MRTVVERPGDIVHVIDELRRLDFPQAQGDLRRQSDRIIRQMSPGRNTPRHQIQRLSRALSQLTAKARPEDAVRARAEALLAYLANVPLAILVANNRGRYVDANRHAATLTGYTRNE